MEVKKYSKLKLIMNLRARGLWDHAKDWMESNGFYDLFVAAQFISSDHQLFGEVMMRAQAELGISGDLVAEILAESEDL